MEMARNGGASAVAWGSAVLDTVSKFDRNSGRALHGEPVYRMPRSLCRLTAFVWPAYGISIDRCRSCRRRLMAIGQTRCENCQYPIPGAGELSCVALLRCAASSLCINTTLRFASSYMRSLCQGRAVHVVLRLRRVLLR